MFTRRYFPRRYFAPRYFPGIGAAIIAVIASYVFFFSESYRRKRKMITLLPPLAVTPSDSIATNAMLTAEFSTGATTMPDQLWVGVSGDVSVVLPDASTFIYPAVAAGGWHDMPFFKGIKATGTTATGIKVSRKRKLQ